MTPEERPSQPRKQERWSIRLHERPNAFPHRRRIRPLVIIFATITAVAVVVAVVFAAFGLGVRSERQPAAPIPVPTSSPTSIPTRASQPIPDDGKVMPLGFTDQVSADSNQEKHASLDDGDSMPWALYQSTRPEDQTIAIAWFSGPGGDCGHHLGVSVAETATTVTIAAVDSTGSPGAFCTSNATLGAGTIRLRSVLGDRTLIHAGLTNSVYLNALPTTAPVKHPDHIGSATCANLLDASTIARLESRGLKDGSAEFSEKIAAAPHQGLHRFLAYGGMVCSWGGGNTNTLGYGYGPITSRQADEAQKAIEAYGSRYVKIKKTVKDGITYYEYNDGALTKYAFCHGYWVSMFDNGGGDVLAQLIANAPTLE